MFEKFTMGNSSFSCMIGWYGLYLRINYIMIMKKFAQKVQRPVFIDIKSDFGFKRCMSDEVTMLSFLNAVLSEDYGRINHLKFENVELERERVEHRGVRFDLRCSLENGDEVLIEMQNYGHRYFKTRANYYLCKMMDKHISSNVVWSEQREDIPRMIGIFILGVPMMELTAAVTKTAECDLDTGEEFWDRMRKYYISLPHFRWETLPKERVEMRDVWMEIFKNLGTMMNVSDRVYELADEGLRRLIDKARVSALSEREFAEYEAGMKDLSDYGTAEAYGYDTGFRKGLDEGRAKGIEEGRAEGRAEGRLEGRLEGINEGKREGKAEGKAEGRQEAMREMALSLRKQGVPMQVIEQCSGLSRSEIEKLS